MPFRRFLGSPRRFLDLLKGFMYRDLGHLEGLRALFNVIRVLLAVLLSPLESLLEPRLLFFLELLKVLWIQYRISGLKRVPYSLQGLFNSVQVL